LYPATTTPQLAKSETRACCEPARCKGDAAATSSGHNIVEGVAARRRQTAPMSFDYDAPFLVTNYHFRTSPLTHDLAPHASSSHTVAVTASGSDVARCPLSWCRTWRRSSTIPQSHALSHSPILPPQASTHPPSAVASSCTPCRKGDRRVEPSHLLANA
jgi:hypothetical protein